MGTDGLRPGTAMSVRLSLFKQGHAFELVNESHTNRIEQYSKIRGSAMTKVASNEIMEGLIEYMQKDDFGNRAVRGSSGTNTTFTKAIDVSIGDEHMHWGVSPSVSEKENRQFLEAGQSIIAVYNQIYSLQTIENPEGEIIFQTPIPKR